MSTSLLLALRFKNEKNEPRAANVYVEHDSGGFFSNARGTYWSASPWVGTTFSGTIVAGDKMFDTDLQLKNSTDGTVAFFKAGFGTFTTFGDTGTGRLYKGCSGAYSNPFNFEWECMATGSEAAKKMTAEQAAQDTAIGIGPFTRP